MKRLLLSFTFTSILSLFLSSLYALDATYYGQASFGNSAKQQVGYPDRHGDDEISLGGGLGATLYQNYSKNGLLLDASYNMQDSKALRTYLVPVTLGYAIYMSSSSFISPKIGYLRYSYKNKYTDEKLKGNALDIGIMAEHHHDEHIVFRGSLDFGGKSLNFGDFDGKIVPFILSFSAGYRF